MHHSHEDGLMRSEEFVKLGNKEIAYVRRITGSEANRAFPDQLNLAENASYWGLFAADGNPLMFAEHSASVLEGAFHNDLHAVLPN